MAGEQNRAFNAPVADAVIPLSLRLQAQHVGIDDIASLGCTRLSERNVKAQR
jgi:hypothetical protein